MNLLLQTLLNHPVHAIVVIAVIVAIFLYRIGHRRAKAPARRATTDA